MICWVDAQLSPDLAHWLARRFSIEAFAIRDIGLREAEDETIFLAARDAKAVVVTKDRDFSELVQRHGPPPQILWIRCGNTSNARLHQVFDAAWKDIHVLLLNGEALVELRDVR
jgi:predicted nuclease of predicted toxin-antitoxin system